MRPPDAVLLRRAKGETTIRHSRRAYVAASKNQIPCEKTNVNQKIIIVAVVIQGDERTYQE